MTINLNLSFNTPSGHIPCNFSGRSMTITQQTWWFNFHLTGEQKYSYKNSAGGSRWCARLSIHLQVLVSHISTNLCLGCSISDLASVYGLGKQGNVTSCCTPAPMWETQKKLLLPGFKSAQFWILWPSGEWTSRWKTFLSASPILSNFAFQVNNF